ncbi:Plant self-incompatibility S1 [Corchorus capsularis]|uniref:S-protein homolog n=1 Tax=Corchorus capsularis TaxID=210143 RepID=A0A1R3G4L0_COCAP|nr:Plant self-incompatibility S1 [Corchorus capsularis]
MANLRGIFIILHAAATVAICLFSNPLAALEEKDEDMLFIKYHIHITNDTPDDMPFRAPNVHLHCKSKNKDVGNRKIAWHEDYHWDTKINYFRTTLFFCYVWWKSKERYFEAFKATRDEERCRYYHNSCLWSVREDGIYFSNNNATWRNVYPW